MVENNVIEVGEEEVTQFLSALEKKIFGTRKGVAPKNPKATTLIKNNFKET